MKQYPFVVDVERRDCKMRKIAIILLSLSMVFAFCACGGPETLQEYMNENPDVEADIFSTLEPEESQGGWYVDISYVDNTVSIVHTAKEPSALAGELLKEVCEEDGGESFQDDIDAIIDTIKEKTGMDVDITVKYRFEDYDEALFWEGDFFESE